MNTALKPAPALNIMQWLNSESPIELKMLRGKVVLIEFFQMLCPGCVSHGLPQAARVAATFKRDDVVVLGVHSVFEHHSAQGTEDALSAFLHEYRIGFPVGMDRPSDHGPIPLTMQAYQLQGTPSTILIDRAGNLHSHHFGQVEDLQLGAQMMSLILAQNREKTASVEQKLDATQKNDGDCDESGCRI